MMTKDLDIPATQSTPAIRSEWARGRLYMDGNSYPENSFEFFTEVFDWIQAHLSTTDGPLHLELGLIYMNTSSVKAMMDIFDMLEEAWADTRDIAVNWYYDPRNERVMEMAEEFREDYTFPFHILPTPREAP
ncbi:protein of unknown function [Ectothiorhodospira magna]|uniref:SiaC family regulatory phosphoprotein domain-containing protein n=1 Tax=Ectothiorhodospira magna TaxID=867345 RepID=A0A1H9F479_9GAMM|nr:biofilm regulation phosphoprotein SiaC [Ectothiorhodospira magna]SEQ32253.1 protein of unknown function [Ectothiorhodospira magna]